MKDHNLFTVIPYKDHLLMMDRPSRAVAYYLNHAVDLLTGKRLSFNILHWIDDLKSKSIDSTFDRPRVSHLFYELGFLIEKEFSFLGDDDLLVIDVEYLNFEKIAPEKFKRIELEKISGPLFENYKKKFDEGYKELLKGNCYQFNLTENFDYSFTSRYAPMDFLFSLWEKRNSRGGFGSATYSSFMHKLFLSNSPECLFHLSGSTLSTMPIKGTFKLQKKISWKKQWRDLAKDSKSQGELYMIADLLRNDLSRIEKPVAKIVKKKAPLLVPGLLHQYSKIDVELSSQVDLWRIIEKIFPGGSITGAPKVRAMRLIQKLEERKRGFYCGSTLILHKDLKCASINIRSSVIDFNSQTLHYQAGGGITLKSCVHDEFKEMTYKHDSFIRTLTVENC